MLIIYCIGLFDGCFGSGVWQCWNCRVPFFLLGWRGTPEEGQNSPAAQTADPAAITPSPAAQVVITPPPQQPGPMPPSSG